MEENKNSNHYSSADIQKYLEGKLSAAEMHAIEKAALDDPFLADAIEGMQNNLHERSAGSFNNDVNELNERLQKRISKKEKIIPVAPNQLWQRIAAIIIILFGSTALIYYYLIKGAEKNKSIAIKNENVIADSVAAKNNSTPAPFKNDSAVVNDVAANEKQQQKNLPEEKLKANFSKPKVAAKKADVDKIPNTDIAKDEEVRRKTVINIKTDTLNTDSLKNQVAASAQPSQALEGKVAGLNIQRAKKFNNNFVQGIVVDNNKNPIAGASIRLKNQKTGTTTDATGAFKLNTNNKDSITNVVVNSIGFQSTEAKLNNNNPSSNLVQLQESTNALNEVVVTGYGTRKEGDNDDESFSSNNKEKVFKAEPSTGWSAFNDYINQNKKITTSDSTKKGKEIISFVVDTSNNLSLFKIKKSLSPAHDAEAIRLIKQGPSWKLLKRKKTKVTLAIEF